MRKEILSSIELNRIYQMDCLEGMKLIPDKSVDMILCDLPYGTTKCKWDTIIPFESLWEQYERIIKDKGAIVLTGTQPFTSTLILSNIKLFKYLWIWEKTMAVGSMFAKKRPMKAHEDICVFYKKQPTYNPQMTKGEAYLRPEGNLNKDSIIGERNSNYITVNEGVRYPRSVIKIANPNRHNIHPTQKPVTLFEYLIKTYTQENEIVLDNCMGSGTTAVACTLNNRKWIGFETESKYIELANKRLEQIQLKDDMKVYE